MNRIPQPDLQKTTGLRCAKSAARLMIGLVLVAGWSGCATTSGPAEWALPQSIDIPGGEVELVLERAGEFFRVEATVEEVGPFWLIFDTGTGGIVLSNEIGTTILDRQPRETGPFLVGVEDEKREVGRFFRVSDFTMAGIRLRNVAVFTVDFGDWSDSADHRPRGFVGLSAFREHVISIDFRSGRFEIQHWTPESLPPRDKALPFRWAGGAVQAEIAAGGQKLWALIDSGSALGLQMPPQTKTVGTWSQWGLARDIEAARRYEIAQLDGNVVLGDTVLKRPWIYSSADVPHANIGMEVLRHFRMTLDTKNGRLWLEGPDDKRLVVEKPQPPKSKQPPNPPSAAHRIDDGAGIAGTDPEDRS